MKNKTIPVRYFMYGYDEHHELNKVEVSQIKFCTAYDIRDDLDEVTENETVTVKHNTMFENGVDQICLTLNRVIEDNDT